MTVSAFQRIRIACDQLLKASADYEALLGSAPIWQGEVTFPSHTTSCGSVWFGLGNTIIELLDWPEVDNKFESHIAGLVMESDDIDATGESVYRSANGETFTSSEQLLQKEQVCQQWVTLEDASLKNSCCPTNPDVSRPSQIQRVDHLVLNTNDADACIAAFGELGLGIRLALDKTVPEWGGRMLFFRTGKLTLEIIHPNKGLEGDDHFWGIAYQVEDLEAFLERAQVDGVKTSEIRQGRKPGTRVASVKSHHLGIPTLLVEPTTSD